MSAASRALGVLLLVACADAPHEGTSPADDTDPLPTTDTTETAACAPDALEIVTPITREDELIRDLAEGDEITVMHGPAGGYVFDIGVRARSGSEAVHVVSATLSTPADGVIAELADLGVYAVLEGWDPEVCTGDVVTYVWTLPDGWTVPINEWACTLEGQALDVELVVEPWDQVTNEPAGPPGTASIGLIARLEEVTADMCAEAR